MYPSSLAIAIRNFFGKSKRFFFFFKNTNLKNYKFFTDDHYYRILHSLKRRVFTFEFNRCYNLHCSFVLYRKNTNKQHKTYKGITEVMTKFQSLQESYIFTKRSQVLKLSVMREDMIQHMHCQQYADFFNSCNHSQKKLTQSLVPLSILKIVTNCLDGGQICADEVNMQCYWSWEDILQ